MNLPTPDRAFFPHYFQWMDDTRERVAGGQDAAVPTADTLHRLAFQALLLYEEALKLEREILNRHHTDLKDYLPLIPNRPPTPERL